ncbi:MAG: hypothetical protein LBE78_01135 [Burkholderiaceae bacterium]|jgi:hypothetical protein|nr:hypothetical protein [Burkholderiaceae bacterium]
MRFFQRLAPSVRAQHAVQPVLPPRFAALGGGALPDGGEMASGATAAAPAPAVVAAALPAEPRHRPEPIEPRQPGTVAPDTVALPPVTPPPAPRSAARHQRARVDAARRQADDQPRNVTAPNGSADVGNLAPHAPEPRDPGGAGFVFSHLEAGQTVAVAAAVTAVAPASVDVSVPAAERPSAATRAAFRAFAVTRAQSAFETAGAAVPTLDPTAPLRSQPSQASWPFTPQRPLSAIAMAQRLPPMQPEATVVHVTVDRIDVRAPAPAAAPRAAVKPRAKPTVSLSDYLHRGRL